MRLRLLRGARGFFILGLFGAGRPIAATFDFFDFVALYELVQDAWEIAPAAVAKIHAVGDLADAQRLRLGGEKGEHVFRRDIGALWIARFDGVAAWWHVRNQATGFAGGTQKMVCAIQNSRILSEGKEEE